MWALMPLSLISDSAGPPGVESAAVEGGCGVEHAAKPTMSEEKRRNGERIIRESIASPT
jgi:hypothetical protein